MGLLPTHNSLSDLHSNHSGLGAVNRSNVDLIYSCKFSIYFYYPESKMAIYRRYFITELL